jgi:hypothetical protein
MMRVAKNEQVRIAPSILVRLARVVALTSSFGRFDVTHLRNKLISIIDQRRNAPQEGTPIARAGKQRSNHVRFWAESAHFGGRPIAA